MLTQKNYENVLFDFQISTCDLFIQMLETLLVFMALPIQVRSESLRCESY